MLSDELTVTPITGFKYQSKEKFMELQKRLEKQVAEGGQEYDTTKGNKSKCIIEERVNNDCIKFQNRNLKPFNEIAFCYDV